MFVVHRNLRVKKRERVIGKISDDGEDQRDDHKTPYITRFEDVQTRRAAERGDQNHRDEKIRENERVEGNHRVKAERRRDVAVKQRVKSARQTAARTGDAGQLEKRADGKKAFGRRIEKPHKTRAAERN